MAARASTMVRLLISSTKELTNVYGMSYTSWGLIEPGLLCPLNSRYVEIRAPKSRHSDPRKAHMPTFSFDSPVEVGGCPSSISVWVPDDAVTQEGVGVMPAPPPAPR